MTRARGQSWAGHETPGRPVDHLAGTSRAPRGHRAGQRFARVARRHRPEGDPTARSTRSSARRETPIPTALAPAPQTPGATRPSGRQTRSRGAAAQRGPFSSRCPRPRPAGRAPARRAAILAPRLGWPDHARALPGKQGFVNSVTTAVLAPANVCAHPVRGSSRRLTAAARRPPRRSAGTRPWQGIAVTNMNSSRGEPRHRGGICLTSQMRERRTGQY